VLTLAVLVTIGSIVGIGVHVWFEPWTSVLAVALGSLVGLAISNAFGQGLLLGLALGAAATLLGLGVRALLSMSGALPEQLPSARVWFLR